MFGFVKYPDEILYELFNIRNSNTNCVMYGDLSNGKHLHGKCVYVLMMKVFLYVLSTIYCYQDGRKCSLKGRKTSINSGKFFRFVAIR